MVIWFWVLQCTWLLLLRLVSMDNYIFKLTHSLQSFMLIYSLFSKHPKCQCVVRTINIIYIESNTVHQQQQPDDTTRCHMRNFVATELADCAPWTDCCPLWMMGLVSYLALFPHDSLKTPPMETHPGAQLLYNLIISDYIKLLVRYF